VNIVLDEFGYKYYRLQSERTIDIDTEISCFEKGNIKPEDIQIGEYYSVDGILTINFTDEVEELYIKKHL